MSFITVPPVEERGRRRSFEGEEGIADFTLLFLSSLASRSRLS